jgi:hypothetical protein
MYNVIVTIHMNHMSIDQSIRGEDQLILNAFRYRKDWLVYCCVKGNCRERTRYDRVSYEIYKDYTVRISIDYLC